MRSPIRVAVIGGGQWARRMHAPALRALPGVEIAGVACRSEDSARACAAALGIPRWTTDARALVADEGVDAIDIVTPSFVREDICAQAAAHGKHIICIKPLATSLDEARRIAGTVRAAGVRFFYAENVPFIPAVGRLRALVRAGRVGTPFRVRTALGLLMPDYAPAWYFDAERGVDLFSEVSSHSIALCRALLEDEVAWVHAEAGNYVLGERVAGPDTAVLTLRFRGGAIAQCEDSWSLAGGPETRVEVFGTRGRAVADAVYAAPVQVLAQAAPAGAEAGSAPDGALLDEGRWAPVAADEAFVHDGHRDMLATFLAALAGDTPAESTLDDALAVTAAVEAARASWRTGRRVAPEAP